mmetsp:Transcript_860/g.2535  ORF Transcript_860/g.2535 Transcript_860/m.2535 type:complete len:193 (-) Transcript_860:2599-3177(-)
MLSELRRGLQRRPSGRDQALLDGAAAAAYAELRLDQLLRDRLALTSLLRFLQLQHAAENLTFYMVAEAFSLVFAEDKARSLGVAIDQSAVVKHARDIYKRFLCDNAPSWVCVEPQLVRKVADAVERHPELVRADIFAEAQEETRRTLERDCLPRFTKCVLEGIPVPGFEVDQPLRDTMMRIASEPETASATE